MQTLNHKKRKEQVKKAFTQQSLFYAGINFCFVKDLANLAQPSISLLVGPQVSLRKSHLAFRIGREVSK